ncbi:MAG: YigZ family protein [Caldilineales bacterium]|nr:YigZ family protein [Caldilineales bacterium]
MGERYPIPGERRRVEQTISRSRFISTVAPAPTVEAARTLLAELRAEFPDASHHCWAYLVGPPGSSSQIGYSDDGEPHGAAGRPMFTVLQHSGLGDVAAVVVRYFGGVKLGTGGLARAYSEGVKQALAGLALAEHVSRTRARIQCSYAHVATLQRLLPAFEAALIAETYAAAVIYEVEVPRARAAGLAQVIAEATLAQATIQFED